MNKDKDMYKVIGWDADLHGYFGVNNNGEKKLIPFLTAKSIYEGQPFKRKKGSFK